MHRYDKERQYPYIVRKITFGVISAVLVEVHFNSKLFSGLLSRLDWNLFDVTYILLPNKCAKIASFTQTHLSDLVYV